VDGESLLENTFAPPIAPAVVETTAEAPKENN